MPRDTTQTDINKPGNEAVGTISHNDHRHSEHSFKTEPCVQLKFKKSKL